MMLLASGIVDDLLPFPDVEKGQEIISLKVSLAKHGGPTSAGRVWVHGPGNAPRNRIIMGPRASQDRFGFSL